MDKNRCIVVQKSNCDEGMYYWKVVTYDGELYADGEEGSYEDAHEKAMFCFNEYESMNQ